MGKNKHRQNKQPPKPPVITEIKPSLPFAKDLETQILEFAETHNLSLEVSNTPIEGVVSQERLDGQFRQIQSFSEQLKRKETSLISDNEKLARREQQLEEEKNALSKRREKLEEDSGLLRKEKVDFERQTSELKRNNEQLTQREKDIKTREADAEIGFLELHKRRSHLLESELLEAEKRLEEIRREIREAPVVWDQEKVRLEAQWQEKALERSKSLDEAQQKIWDIRINELDTARENLVAEQNLLARQKRELAKKEQQLTWTEEDLVSDKALLAEQIEQRALKYSEQLKQEIEALKQSLQDSRERNKRLEADKSELEQQLIQAGGSSAAALQKRINQLEKEKQQLEQQIANLPTAEEGQRLRRLEEREQTDKAELERLRLESHELESRLERQKIATSELQTLRERKLSLETINRVLEQERNQLQEQLDGLVERNEAKEVFQACREIFDSSQKLGQPELTEQSVNLKRFVESMRLQIATDAKLDYSPEVIRSFVAGLATSRLHLLQGISGVGKTSLPQVFTKFISGITEKIEVQAGWRDRQDLIGHYNAFEKKFYEQKFLRAIYQAGTEFYRDRLYFIVLDEMNLSHPEQYFADVLSGLEGQGNFDLELIQSKVNQQELPERFKVHNGGIALPVPNNIWFIGTANEDETTQKFAEKTFDRAHVMSITRHSSETNQEFEPLKPVSFRVLTNEFQRVIAQREPETQPCLAFLEQLREPLQDFDIGWGNRLEAQAKKFIPVYLEAGGTISQALDELIATKIFRKVVGRFENTVEGLKNLEKALEGWEFPDRAEQSLLILEKAIRKVERGNT